MLERLNSDHSLWKEKYRPKNIDEYITTEAFAKSIKRYIANGDIPHLLLHSKKPGSGKTTLAKILATTLDCDFIYINASDENGIDTVRERINGFASSVGMSDLKVIILDEFDRFSLAAQEALRSPMETYSKTTRFIMTCNYVDRIVEPIRSRCTEYNVATPDIKLVAKRMMEILTAENVKFEPTVLASIVKETYPDMRKTIEALQNSVEDGVLVYNKEMTVDTQYMQKVVEILTSVTKKRKKEDVIAEIRAILVDASTPDYNPLYSYLYENVDTYGKNNVAQCILLISDASYKDAFRVDKEIGAAALLLELVNVLIGD